MQSSGASCPVGADDERRQVSGSGLPPEQNLFSGQSVHDAETSTISPKNPPSHRQSLIASLPEGEEEFLGQGLQEVAFLFLWYVLEGHSLQFTLMLEDILVVPV